MVPPVWRHLSRALSRALISRGSRRITSGVASVSLAALSACQDEMPEPVAIAPVSSTAALVGDPDANSWNRFEVDVAITMDGQLAPGVVKSRPSRAVSYHLVRRKDATGQWVSDQEFGPLVARASTGNPGLGPPRITRVVGFRPGVEPAIYDAAGRRVNLGGRSYSMKTKGARPNAPQAPARTRSSATHASILQVADTARDWIDHFIVTAAGLQRERARLSRAFGAPSRSGPKSRFARSVGNRRQEVEVSDSTGLPDVIRVSQGNRILHETTRQYDRRADGALVLSSERTTQFDAKGLAALTMVTQYRNGRLLEDR